MSDANKPAVYTHGHNEAVLRSHTWRTATNSAAYLLPHLQPNMTILDIGCGPGTITCDFAKLVPQGKVVGLEPGPEVLEKARATAASRGVENVEFVVGDVHKLSYADATFDVVHAHQVLQHVGDPVQALREMRRVTKPGGVVASRETDFSAMTWYPSQDGDSMAKWRELYKKVARANGGEPDAGRRIHVWAHEAGFDRANIICSASTWLYCTPEERAWWSGLWADRTLTSNFATTAINNGLATQKDLEDVAKTWKEWGAHPDAWFAILNGEIICRV